MAKRLDIVGPHFVDRLALCHAVSCLESGNVESVQGCLSDMATVLGDVSDTLSILSDYECAAREHRGLVCISDDSLSGATRLMSDIVAVCAALTNACNEALPRAHREASDEG